MKLRFLQIDVWRICRFMGMPAWASPVLDGRTIEVIDLDKRSVVDTIDLGGPTRPHCPKFGPGGMLYVSAELDNAPTSLIPILRNWWARFLPQRRRATCLSSRVMESVHTRQTWGRERSALDLVARKTVKVIPVAKTVQRIAISMDDRYVFTADQEQPRLAVIDTTKNEVTQWIALPGIGYGTAPTSRRPMAAGHDAEMNQVAVGGFVADEGL